MRVFMCLFAALFLLTSPASLADKVYRWTDDNGQVHFGNRPPAHNQQAEEMVIRTHTPSSTPAPEEDAKTGQANNKSAEAEPATEEKPSIDPEIAARNCRVATEQKKLLSENYNRRFKQPDGEVRPLTDAERNSRLKQMNAAIKKYCP